MLKPLTRGCERAAAGSAEGVGSMTEASGAAGLGCSGVRCDDLSHPTFSLDHEGSWRRILVQGVPG